MLLEAGADKDLQGDDGYAALMSACEGGHIEVARMLSEAGADANMANQGGHTALDCECFCSHFDILPLLAQKFLLIRGSQCLTTP